MSKQLTAAALLGLSLLLPSARAVAPPDTMRWRPEAERQVGRLADPDFRVRDDAERRLRAMGVKVVPALRKALGHRDREVRRRALNLIPLLEAEALLAPRRVTLKVDKKPVRAILEELTKQTGYKFAVWSPRPVAPKDEPAYNFDLKNVTFWEAFDRVSEATGLVLLQQTSSDAPFHVTLNGSSSRFVGRAGAFRYAGSNFHLSRQVDLGPPARPGDPPRRSESLTFNFTIFAEPRLPFLSVGEPYLDAAYDDRKNSMLVPRGAADGPNLGGGTRYHGSHRQLSLPVNLTLHRASDKATTLKVLRGSVPVTLVVEQKALIVTDKVLEAKKKQFTVDGVKFAFEDVTKQPNGQYQLKMTIRNDDAADYAWRNSLYYRLGLEDDKGQKYQVWASSSGGSMNHAELSFTYGPRGGVKAGPPTRFTYQTWKTRPHNILFEFRDVPLP